MNIRLRLINAKECPCAKIRERTEPNYHGIIHLGEFDHPEFPGAQDRQITLYQFDDHGEAEPTWAILRHDRKFGAPVFSQDEPIEFAALLAEYGLEGEAINVEYFISDWQTEIMLEAMDIVAADPDSPYEDGDQMIEAMLGDHEPEWANEMWPTAEEIDQAGHLSDGLHATGCYIRGFDLEDCRSIYRDLCVASLRKYPLLPKLKLVKARTGAPAPASFVRKFERHFGVELAASNFRNYFPGPPPSTNPALVRKGLSREAAVHLIRFATAVGFRRSISVKQTDAKKWVQVSLIGNIPQLSLASNVVITFRRAHRRWTASAAACWDFGLQGYKPRSAGYAGRLARNTVEAVARLNESVASRA